MANRMVTLAASAARTATSTGEGPVEIGPCVAIAFQLNVTALATEVGDHLDVWVQSTIDGTNWFDVVQFVQLDGTDSAVIHIEKLESTTAQAGFVGGTALAAEGTTRNVFGQHFRARWVVTDAGADNASFTFSVTAVAMG